MIDRHTAVRPEHLPVRPLRTLSSLYNKDQMEFVLQRERSRCDRTGEPMSLIAFRLASKPSSRQIVRLRRVLLARVRLTDEVGWLDNGMRLAALLPGTDKNGAQHVARDVCAAVQRYGLKLSVGIMCYPDNLDELTAGGTDAADAGTLTRWDLLPFVVEGMIDELTRENAHEQQGNRAPVAPMQGLLVRPMPWWKRTIDIAFSAFGLAVLWPVLAVIAILIRLTSRGPAIFKQQRTGLGGRVFTIYKFRTMVQDAEAQKEAMRPLSEQDGPAFKLTNDPRVTKIGHFLRSTSLDELPQLWNVLKGDMSLVGPRPLPVSEADGCTQWQKRRHDVTPGLTCLWQVEGRSTVSFITWMRMDARYVAARNLTRDLKLLFWTIPSVLLRKGAR